MNEKFSTRTFSPWLGWLLLGLLLAGVLWHYGNLKTPELCTGDEALTALRTRGLMEQGHYWTPYWNGSPDVHKPPFYFWCSAFWAKLLGMDLLAVRLPSVISFLGLLVLTFVFTRRMAGVAVAVLAVWLMGLHPLLLDQSCVGMFDTMMLFLWTGAAYSLLRVDESSKWFYPWGLLCALALLTKAEGASFVIPVSGLYILCMRPRFLRDRHLYLGTLVMVLVAGIWFGSQWISLGDTFLTPHYKDMVDYRLKHNMWQSFLNQKTTRYLWSSWGGLAPLMFGTPLLLFWPRKRGVPPAEGPTPSQRFLVYLMLVVPLVMISLVHQQMHWYLLPAVPPTAILCAILLRDFVKGQLRVETAVIVPALLFAGTFLDHAYIDSPALIWGVRLLTVTVVLLVIGPTRLKKWATLPLAVAMVAAIVGGLSLSNPSVNLNRVRNASQYDKVARLMRHTDATGKWLIINWKYFPQNSFMFYSHRNTIQLNRMATYPVKAGETYDAVIIGDYHPFLSGLTVWKVGEANGFNILRVKNETDETIVPAEWAKTHPDRSAEPGEQ